LLSAVKRVSIFSNRSTHQIALDVAEDKTTVRTEDPRKSIKSQRRNSFKTYRGKRNRGLQRCLFERHLDAFENKKYSSSSKNSYKRMLGFSRHPRTKQRNYHAVDAY
jgi:hypothetical protein